MCVWYMYHMCVHMYVANVHMYHTHMSNVATVAYSWTAERLLFGGPNFKSNIKFEPLAETGFELDTRRDLFSTR